MDSVAPLLPAAPDKRKPCPDRIEVDSQERIVSAATVKAWLTHLRSHGWTDQDLGIVWLSRAKQGVTR
jgi:hypothetical protein